MYHIATYVRDKRNTNSKDYYVAAMLNYGSATTAYYFYITTTSSTPVSYTVKSYTSSVVSSGSVSQNLPRKITLSTSQIVSSHFWSERQKGYHVHTDGPSNLFVFNYQSSSIGEYTAYPYEKLSGVSTYTYYVVSSGTKATASRSQILLVGNEASTTITVYPTATVVYPSNTQSSIVSSIYSSGSKTFTLHKLQTLLLRTSSYLTDLSGTRITSNKPLTVVTGHQCGNIPTAYVYCEHISEQIPPTVDWDKTFLLTPYLFRTRQYFLVVSQADSTTVQHNCNEDLYTTNINAGQRYIFYTGSTAKCYLKASEPVMVTQMAPGNGLDKIGDPAISLLPPMTKFDTSTSFYLPSFIGITQYGFNIVAKQKTGTWQRNGLTMSTLTWSTIYDFNSNVAGYYTRVQLSYLYSNKAHRITNTANNEFYVLGYAFGQNMGYSFTVGFIS